MPNRKRLPRALAAWQAYERLGSPEGDLAIASLVIYLATAPKSNAAYAALKAATRAAAATGSLMPPAHILNAPTKMMKDLGYGRDYAYDHDDPDGFSGQNGFPDDMERQRFYTPVERGYEREIAKRLAWWDKLRAEKAGGEGGILSDACYGIMLAAGGWRRLRGCAALSSVASGRGRPVRHCWADGDIFGEYRWEAR